MAFDGLMVKAVTEELAAELKNGRIERVLQPDKDEIILQIRKPGESLRLLISFHAELARIHLTEENRLNPATPPAFCMLLRKHLEGARIIEIKQIGFERIIHIRMETYENINRPTEKLLIFELTGRHSNLALIDSLSGTVLDAGKRIIPGQSRHRELIPNIPYSPPPAQDKTDPLIVETEDAFIRILDGEENKDLKLDRFLADTFLNISRFSAKEIVKRAGLDENTTWKTTTYPERSRLWNIFEQTINPKYWEPHLILKPDKMGYEEFIPVRPTGFKPELLLPFFSVNKMLDFYFTQSAKQRRLQSHKSQLVKGINQTLKRYHKKIALQENEFIQAENAEYLRIEGELLLANLHQLRGGEREIEVINFYEPDNPLVTLELDPQLSPSQNAQKKFKKYAKAKSTINQLTKQLAANRMEAAYLEGIVFNIDEAANLEQLEEIREELKLQGYLKTNKKGQKQKTDKSGGITEPLQFISSDGLPILVGRNNTQNDYLTLRVAKNNDVWLHAKDIPGSHVIIKNQFKEIIPDSTLEEAAILAAYFSKGRNSNNVPIDYTTKKNVHKPNNAKPGLVIYDNYKTVYVKPDRQRIDKLKSKNFPPTN